LGQGLENLTSLQHLSLNFYGFVHNPFITNFSLERCKQFITDDGLGHLKTGLQKLTSLKHLELKFEGCVKVTDSGLDYVKQTLEGLVSLRHVSLHLVGYFSAKILI